MRLCTCHIENFGKLCDFYLELQEGCTSLCCENGWGKSTLAAFIRVMFYGFEGEKKRKERNERNFYRPWQGGVYGGWLVFETEGKLYRITRVFGKKESDDIFELRNEQTNRESKDYTSAVGRELFGIDSESFMRTIFIGQNDCGTKATGDINAKMGNLTDHTEDLTDYEAADESLKNLLNCMTPRRKTGELHQLRAQITELETAVKTETVVDRNLRELQQKAEEKKEELESLRKFRLELERRQQKAAAMKEAQTKWEGYRELQKRCEEAESEVKNARSAFPGKIPERERLESWQKLCGELAEACTALRSYRLKPEEEKQLQEIEAVFAEKIPSEENLEQCKARIRRLETAEKEAAENRMTEKEHSDLEKYRQQFAGEEKPSLQLGILQKKWERRVQQKATLEVKQKSLEQEMQDRLRQEQEEKQSRDKRLRLRNAGAFLSVILLAVTGISCVLTGGFSIWSGCALAVFAVVFCLMVWQPYVSEKKNTTKQTPEQNKELEKEVEKKTEEIAGIDREIADYLRKLGVSTTEDQISFQLQEWLKNAVRYEDLSEKEKRERKHGRKKECEELVSEIDAFLQKYKILFPGKTTYMECLLCLENRLREWQRLKEQKKAAERQQQSCKAIQGRIKEELREYGFELSEDLNKQLLKLREMLQNLEQKEQILRTEQARKAEFVQKNSLSEMDEKVTEETVTPSENLEALNAEHRKLTDRSEELQNILRGYEKQMEALREKSDEIAEQKEMLEEQKQMEEKETKKYMLLKRTKELLEEAKETLTARYIRPLKTRYDYYDQLLEDGESETGKYHLDANAELTVEEKGMQRKVESFSAGYQDLMGLCLRLAFIDVMYTEERPMLILDDPFVNLDQEKTEKAKKLLEDVSVRYQILYLTCNENRMWRRG